MCVCVCVLAYDLALAVADTISTIHWKPLVTINRTEQMAWDTSQSCAPVAKWLLVLITFIIGSYLLKCDHKLNYTSLNMHWSKSSFIKHQQVVYAALYKTMVTEIMWSLWICYPGPILWNRLSDMIRNVFPVKSLKSSLKSCLKMARATKCTLSSSSSSSLLLLTVSNVNSMTWVLFSLLWI